MSETNSEVICWRALCGSGGKEGSIFSYWWSRVCMVFCCTWKKKYPLRSHVCRTYLILLGTRYMESNRLLSEWAKRGLVIFSYWLCFPLKHGIPCFGGLLLHWLCWNHRGRFSGSVFHSYKWHMLLRCLLEQHLLAPGASGQRWASLCQQFVLIKREDRS